MSNRSDTETDSSDPSWESVVSDDVPEVHPDAPRRPAGRIAPWYVGALSGTVAAIFAVGVGLVSAQMLTTTSPTDAVGAAFVDRVPKWLKNLAIDWFGTSDKTALKVGMFMVMAALAVLLGWRSLRRPMTGAVGFALFALLGLLCALDRPNSDGAIVVPPLLAGPAGIAALLISLRSFDHQWRRANSPQRSRAPLGWDRRRFVVASGGFAAAGAALSGTAVALEQRRVNRLRAAAGASLPPLATDATTPTVDDNTGPINPVTPFITPNDDFYRIDTALSFPFIDLDTWRLRIGGLVEREREFSFAELLEMEQVERTITLCCVSNEVGGDLVGTARWRGVLLADVLRACGVQSSAEQVFSTSADGWTCGFPVAAAFDGRDAMIALGMNNEALPLEHGYPARLVIPGLYGYVSATKWLTSIRLTTWADDVGYWVPRGWSREAPVKTQSRIDVPKRGARLDAGTVPVAGVAWAQGRGIVRVEIQIDDGPWVQAELGAENLDDAWRLWRYAWDATPGDHRITVRATDGEGVVQTDEVAPPDPDGATGHHSRRVTVR